MATHTPPDIQTVREMARQYSNWKRWGEQDELGTLNFVTPERVAEAACLAKTGRTYSLSIACDERGPQAGGLMRFNPMHFMLRDGANAVVGTTARDFFGGVNRHTLGTDDVILMPTHSATHWDALAHITFEGKIYNGFEAIEVSCRGARKASIDRARDKIVGRGVLLDVARAQGKQWLDPGEAISDEVLRACADTQGVAIRPGDFLLVRTGQMAQVAHQGTWGSYAGGDAPGLGLASVPWLHASQVAGVATDTWGAEVRPNETSDVFQPLHILLIASMGLTVGEMFYLEDLAADCAHDRVHEFFFAAPPLRITGGVGSPVNPIAVK